jgi:hypothetical protein
MVGRSLRVPGFGLLYLTVPRQAVHDGRSTNGGHPAGNSSRLSCEVWLIMMEIEEVPVQILYGELP